MSKHKKKASKTSSPHQERLSEPSADAGFDLIQDSDPETGARVVHAIRRDATVVDRLYRAGGLGDPEQGGKLHQAGEQFRRDFERARLMGHYGSVDLLRGRSGRAPSEIDDSSVAARERVVHALAALGYAPGNPGTIQSRAAWWVIGEQVTIEQFVTRMRSNNLPMNEGKASGLVIAALERLAVHYGLITIRRAQQASKDNGRAEGLCVAAAKLLRRATQERSAAAAARSKLDAARAAGDDPAGLRPLRKSYVESRIAAQVLAEMSASFEREGRRLLGLLVVLPPVAGRRR